MTKYICIAILLTGFLTSCTTNRSLVDMCPAYSQLDTQTDSTLFVVNE